MKCMNYKGRSLYNYLQHEKTKDFSDVESWQIHNYRNESTESLLELLHDLSLPLNMSAIDAYIESVDSPEELLECLVLDSADSKYRAKVYLVIFELYRRSSISDHSFSTFADECDMCIYGYEHDTVSQQDIIPLLLEFHLLLDDAFDSPDQEMSKQDLFEETSHYFAHDIESFLFDFFSDLADSEHEETSTLLDGFKSYVSEPLWLELLSLRLLIQSEYPEYRSAVYRFFEEAVEYRESALLIELLDYTLQYDMESYFLEFLEKSLPYIDQEDAETLQELCDQFLEKGGDKVGLLHILHK